MELVKFFSIKKLIKFNFCLFIFIQCKLLFNRKTKGQFVVRSLENNKIQLTSFNLNE